MRYCISSPSVDVERSARAVRSHRSIENSCRWTLGVAYREKALWENFARLNRLTLSLPKQHPGKGSIAKKLRACSWSDKSLMEVLADIMG